MKIIFPFTLGIIVFVVSASAHATTPWCSQEDNSVRRVGVDEVDGTVYVKVDNYNNGCDPSCTKFRFKPANADTDKVLSILLAARLSGNKVRVDLISADCDSAYRVYLQE